MQYPQLFNRYVCPVFVTSAWLLVARPYLQSQYDTELGRLRAKAAADLSAGRRKQAATEEELTDLALHGLYLFPHITSAGQLDFTKPMTHAAATKHLTELRVFADMKDYAFTWHGVVSSASPHSRGERSHVFLLQLFPSLCCRGAMRCFS